MFLEVIYQINIIYASYFLAMIILNSVLCGAWLGSEYDSSDTDKEKAKTILIAIVLLLAAVPILWTYYIGKPIVRGIQIFAALFRKDK